MDYVWEFNKIPNIKIVIKLYSFRSNYLMKNITFKDAMPEYINYIKLKTKVSTYENNIKYIDKYILPFFENKNIFDLNFKDIISWQNYINTFSFTYNYKSNIFYNLSGFLDYCILFFGLDRNVAKIFGNFKNNDIISETGNIWTIEEFNQFIKCVDDIIYKTLFDVLYFTGLRKGELLGLKWKDIDFIDKTININKQLTKKGTITTPKTKKSNRIIYLDDFLMNELLLLKEYYIEKYNFFNDNYFVFGYAKYISFTTLKRKKDFYCSKANVKQIKIHEFRHSHAVLLYQNDIPIIDIKNRLGHENMSTTTDTYLKNLPRDEKRVINTLNSLRLKNNKFPNIF